MNRRVRVLVMDVNNTRLSLQLSIPHSVLPLHILSRMAITQRREDENCEHNSDAISRIDAWLMNNLLPSLASSE